MRLRTVSVVVGLVLGASVAVHAQYRNGQARPQSAAPRPGPSRAAAGEAPFRNTATFRRGRGVPTFPLVWGWGAMVFSYGAEGTPFVLEDGPTGGVQLDIQPWRASVFVDGTYAGRVDEFRGYYQHLGIVAGAHQIVVIEPGFQPLVIDAIVVPGETTTYRGSLHDLVR